MVYKGFDHMRFVLITLLLISPLSMANTLTVGLIDQDRPPYFLRPNANQPARGMYIDILEEVSQRTGIEFEYKFLPQNRVRASLKYGAIDIEPGIDPIWRKEDGEQEASIYSETMFISEEVLVYNSERFTSTPDPDELVKLSNCMVVGFNALHYGTSPEEPHQIITESQILDLIRLGRCDWALFPLDVFNSNEKHTGLSYTSPVATYKLSLRLHKSNQKHLDAINQAIRHLKDSGEMAEILDSYIAD